MIRRNEISRRAFLHGVPERTIQKDYVITRVLRELGPGMSSAGVRFKGGTCLKKAHFAEYRFSEDLDFTLEPDHEIAEAEAVLNEMAARLSGEDLPFALGDPQRRGGGMTYVAETSGPLGSADKLKIDVTTRELLLFPPVSLELIDEYSDGVGAIMLNCYTVEEVFVEKVVCMLDPARIQPRDLFDLDYLIGRDAVDVEVALWRFPEKARFKGLDPDRLHSVIERKSPQLRRRWYEQLEQQLPADMLPGYDDAERGLLRVLRELGLA